MGQQQQGKWSDQPREARLEAADLREALQSLPPVACSSRQAEPSIEQFRVSNS